MKKERCHFHITVQKVSDLEHLKRIVKEYKAKVTVIDLENKQQDIMITKYTKTVSEALKIAPELESYLRFYGFKPIRTKIEAEETSVRTADFYVELHYKLEVPTIGYAASVSHLKQNAKIYKFAISNNPNETNAHFITARNPSKIEGETLDKRILDFIKASNYKLLERKKEFIVFDSDPTSDDWWLKA